MSLTLTNGSSLAYASARDLLKRLLTLPKMMCSSSPKSSGDSTCKECAGCSKLASMSWPQQHLLLYSLYCTGSHSP